MSETSERPALLHLRPDRIPQALIDGARWCCWRAEWNPRGHGGVGKWEKIPVHPKGYGLSTKRPSAWVSYREALAAYEANPAGLAGLGVLVNGGDLVGVDLDHCVSGNTIAPWARELVEQAHTYTELSPSGTGLRLVMRGATDCDWTNHEQGIEVYGGHTPRFLTITGHRLKVAPDDVAPAPEGLLQGLASRYAREREVMTPALQAMPDLVDDLALPDVAALDIPWQAREFLTEGTSGGDRSRDLFNSALALFNAGLDDATVLSVLAASPWAMEVALDHRRQDHDRALAYLWVEHCVKAKPRAQGRVATAEDFEDVSEAQAVIETVKGASKPALRFAFTQAASYTQRQPVRWLVKKVLPWAEVGAVFGESGAGKSFWALDLVLAVAQGTPWREFKTQQAGVAYVCAEGAGGFAMRLRAHAEYHGTDLASVPLHVLADAPNLLEKKDVTDLVAALRLLPGLGVVVVDTLAQATPGANENGGEDMGRALAHCRAIHRATGAMVLLVAHAGKDTSKGIRGWSGIKGALDVEIHVERSGQHRAATITKMKDGEGEGLELPFALDTVVLGQDEDGEDITSCIVKPAQGAMKAARKAEPKGAVQRLVLRVAEGLTDLPGDTSQAALIDAAVAEMPVPDEGARDKRRYHAMRALEALVSSGTLSLAGGVVTVQNAAG